MINHTSILARGITCAEKYCIITARASSSLASKVLSMTREDERRCTLIMLIPAYVVSGDSS